MAKRSKNLSLDPEVVRRAERYSEIHATSVSRLVSDFLSGLPLDGELEGTLPPVVRRLHGIAAGGEGVEEYRRHLEEKYGR